jgi:protein-histidine pros-kinase
MDITDELATQLLNAAPDPTVIVDQRGTIIYANARVSEVLGYTNQELVGEVIEVLIPERARAGHPQHRENFFGHPKARAMGDTLELHAVRKDGVEIPVEISLSETSPCKKKLHNSWSKRTEQRVDSWRQPAMTCVSQFRH